MSPSSSTLLFPACPGRNQYRRVLRQNSCSAIFRHTIMLNLMRSFLAIDRDRIPPGQDEYAAILFDHISSSQGYHPGSKKSDWEKFLRDQSSRGNRAIIADGLMEELFNAIGSEMTRISSDIARAVVARYANMDNELEAYMDQLHSTELSDCIPLIPVELSFLHRCQEHVRTIITSYLTKLDENHHKRQYEIRCNITYAEGRCMNIYNDKEVCKVVCKQFVANLGVICRQQYLSDEVTLIEGPVNIVAGFYLRKRSGRMPRLPVGQPLLSTHWSSMIPAKPSTWISSGSRSLPGAFPNDIVIAANSTCPDCYSRTTRESCDEKSLSDGALTPSSTGVDVYEWMQETTG
jgi:hypothetical protein